MHLESKTLIPHHENNAYLQTRYNGKNVIKPRNENKPPSTALITVNCYLFQVLFSQWTYIPQVKEVFYQNRCDFLSRPLPRGQEFF